MANPAYMTDRFETEKNLKASGYTVGICVLLVILLLFITWTSPFIPPPPLDEGIEVNLGNSDQGLGTNQPFLPGKPSPQDAEKYSPPKQNIVEKAAAKELETDDKNADAPAIKKPLVTKPEATRIPDKDIADNKPVKVKQPVETPPAPKPKPKAIFHGVNGTGTGGNDADNFKPGGNQGIAGGTGDQGAPGGNPNSNNYTGNGGRGNSGISIARGLQGRNIQRYPSFTDDFNENAKVAVDIQVAADGSVTSAQYQLRGSTTSEPNLTSIALRKARQIKFNATGSESFGTIIFNLRVKN